MQDGWPVRIRGANDPFRDPALVFPENRLCFLYNDIKTGEGISLHATQKR